MAFQWATQRKANIPAECHCCSRQQQGETEGAGDRAELHGDNGPRGVFVCACVRARVLSRIIRGTIKWGEPGFKTWCDQRGMSAGSRAWRGGGAGGGQKEHLGR